MHGEINYPNLKIVIEVIPHNQQRYRTLGDYWWEGDTLQIRVSRLGDWRYEFLIADHEMHEALITKHRGIEEPTIKAFDEEFERKRDRGEVGEWDEPGDAKDAPYKREHFFSGTIERIVMPELDVDMKEYDRVMGEVDKEWEKDK